MIRRIVSRSGPVLILCVLMIGVAQSYSFGDLFTTQIDLVRDAVPVPEEFQLTQVLDGAAPAVLFLNFEGGTLRHGGSSSKQNTSFLVKEVATIPPFDHSPYGDDRQQVIDSIVDLVSRDYAPYNVTVVAQRPSHGDYTMVMVGGSRNDLDDDRLSSGIVGLAPLDIGNPNRNDVVFAFSESLSRIEELARGISHWAGHSFGLQNMQKDSIMFPSLGPRPSQFVRGEISGTQQTQDQPGMLQHLFGVPSASASSGLDLRADLARFDKLEPSLAPRPGVDDASFVSQTLPSRLHPGQRFLARLTFRNTGTGAWSAATGHGLFSASSTWGGTLLPFTSSVARGEARTVEFYATAPSRPGTYRFEWSVARHGVPFGASSKSVMIRVEADSPGERVPHGQLELVNGRFGYGWAYDPDAPDKPLFVQVYVDGKYVAATTANLPRDDHEVLGLPDAKHGFSFKMPPGAEGTTRRVTAYAVDDKGQQAFPLPGEFIVLP